ncbi:MAG: Arc family DNA-binding protein [Gluconobacter potus]|uniref:Arc family DNA-binding protein n=1 Tax=Gluconobacter potus TaxID=2724927 RepID=A0ABR9YP99_9PROT|nr:Arc family DNA-binding protein [Gluconobacter sp. R71656]MBF0868612.1 Arc family DNA-binding protein [Gluconobacter sp. R75628]MBF0874559.1 Arc family DNA-binding protein [Gluconobacter sp. R75629]MBF0883634.1 Arc family DNA-binding protein [Gluconobacter potus]
MTTSTITFRMDEATRQYLEDRARRHDRSMNKEFSAIMRELREKEKAPDPAVGSKSDAFHQ